MKLRKLALLNAFVFVSSISIAQTSDCLTSGAGKKPLYDAQKAKKAAMTMDSISDFKGSTAEYKRELEFRLKAERYK
jgi:hypothetical protein